MKKLFTLLITLALAFPAYAHELTPTYFDLKPSYMDGVYVATLTIFNRRNDVQYYEIGVFDGDWNSLDFATTEKIIQVNYQTKKTFDVYIKKTKRVEPVYICTISKLIKSSETATMISSKVCSKIK